MGDENRNKAIAYHARSGWPGAVRGFVLDAFWFIAAADAPENCGGQGTCRQEDERMAGSEDGRSRGQGTGTAGRGARRGQGKGADLLNRARAPRDLQHAGSLCLCKRLVHQNSLGHRDAVERLREARGGVEAS